MPRSDAGHVRDSGAGVRPAGPQGVGSRIRSARLARGITQSDLAREVGVSRSAVAQWETDRAGQVRGNLTRIATVLSVSVGELLGEDSGTTGPPAGAGADGGTELALLRLYRACAEEDRVLLLRAAHRLARLNARSG
jgi:transcriptional regulator with XRE-family HTH domain